MKMKQKKGSPSYIIQVAMRDKEGIQIILAGVLLTSLLLALLVGSQLFAPASSWAASSQVSGAHSPEIYKSFLPFVGNSYPWTNLFGVESNSSFYEGNIFTNAVIDLRSGYVRLNGRISWRQMQPEQGDPINWELLASFEAELRTLRELNITPIVVVDDYPRWATDNTVRDDGQPTSCGPLLPERYIDFAVFMQALASRYKKPEFNVHNWELGNEPDVDPNMVAPDSHYGCWGDWDEPLYNGDAYGQMLITVSQATKEVDPLASIWVGGLLLSSPQTNDPYHVGRPELFLQGILQSGAGPYIDVVGYHAYLQWNGQRTDQDISAGTVWDAWGGVLRGKANFLRLIMSQYGMNIPLFINETGMICGWCDTQPTPVLEQFFDMQANVAARSFPRAMAHGISGMVWYTLDGPGWRYCGLLNELQEPKPAYDAYNAFMDLTYGWDFLGPVDYGTGIEAYAFGYGAQEMNIIYTIEDVISLISIPQTHFIAAYDRFGTPIVPIPNYPNYELSVQFEPIYLVRTR
jgi:hypothetical protein